MTDERRGDGTGDGFDADDWFARAFGAPEPPPVDPAIEGAPHTHDALPPTEAMPFETAHLPEVAPDAADAPAFEPLATQAFDPLATQAFDPLATQAIDAADLPVAPPPLVEPPAHGEPPPTQAMDAAELPADPSTALERRPIHPPPAVAGGPVDAAAPPAAVPGDATSGIDTLFADHRFQEYAPGADPTERPWADRPAKPVSRGDLVRVPVAPPPAGAEHDGLSRTQKILFGVGGGLLAVLSLIALFLLGTRLPDILGPAPAAIVTPSPTPTPSVTALPVGPVAPGTYEWDELLGGECLDPWVDPWQEEFTVVDCAQPHPAQLVYRGLFPETADGAFPGVEALQGQIPVLCTAPGVVDLAAAGQYTDAQIQGSFPVTEEQWQADRSYFCFVSRSSGEPLSGSVAVPQPPAGG